MIWKQKARFSEIVCYEQILVGKFISAIAMKYLPYQFLSLLDTHLPGEISSSSSSPQHQVGAPTSPLVATPLAAGQDHEC